MGVTNYYKYNDKTVIIDKHMSCGNFITEYQKDISFADCKFSIPFRRNFLGYILHTTIDNLKENSNKEDILKEVIKELSLHYDTNEINENIDNIKFCIALIINQVDFNDIYSETLTDDILKKLERTTTICW